MFFLTFQNIPEHSRTFHNIPNQTSQTKPFQTKLHQTCYYIRRWAMNVSLTFQNISEHFKTSHNIPNQTLPKLTLPVFTRLEAKFGNFESAFFSERSMWKVCFIFTSSNLSCDKNCKILVTRIFSTVILGLVRLSSCPKCFFGSILNIVCQISNCRNFYCKPLFNVFLNFGTF